MAINKKALNKRYAKNVYSKRKKVKSVKSNYNSVYNSVPTAVSKYTAYSNSGSKKSANEDVAQYAMFSSAKAVNFAAHNVSQLPKSETACFFNSYKTSHTSGLSQAENISNKSNFLNVSSSGKNEKDKNYKKRTYERNRRRLYKSKRKRLSTVKAYKSAASDVNIIKNNIIWTDINTTVSADNPITNKTFPLERTFTIPAMTFFNALAFLLSLESESIAVRSAVSTGLRKYTEPSEFMIK